MHIVAGKSSSHGFQHDPLRLQERLEAGHSVVLPACFAFAQRALALAASFALAAALNFFRFFSVAGFFAANAPLPRYAAHRAFAAAAIAARPARDMRRFFRFAGLATPLPATASILLWSFSTRFWVALCSFSIFFLMAMTLTICSVDKSLSIVMG
jgi:hypothetical protein